MLPCLTRFLHIPQLQAPVATFQLAERLFSAPTGPTPKPSGDWLVSLVDLLRVLRTFYHFTQVHSLLDSDRLFYGLLAFLQQDTALRRQRRALVHLLVVAISRNTGNALCATDRNLISSKRARCVNVSFCIHSTGSVSVARSSLPPHRY